MERSYLSEVQQSSGIPGTASPQCATRASRKEESRRDKTAEWKSRSPATRDRDYSYLMASDRNLGRKSAPRPDLDEVNDASFDSFPASDAPVWSSMHAGPPRFGEAASTSKYPATSDAPSRDLAPPPDATR
jgi:hypothetical protein